MLKKFILAILLLMVLCTSVVSAEGNDRWIPIDDPFSSWNRYIDGSTINYDAENGDFVYWVKRVNQKGEIMDISKIKASPKNKTYRVLYNKIYWSKALDDEFKTNKNLILILPEGDIEEEVNILCEKYHQPYVWGHKEYSWVKAVTDEEYNTTWYVCSDTFLKNETTNEYIMFAKIELSNKDENSKCTIPSFFMVNIKDWYLRWMGEEPDNLLIPESDNELFFSVSKKIITTNLQNAYPFSKIKGSELIKL